MAKRIFSFILKAILLFLVVSFLWVLSYKFINPPLSMFMLRAKIVDKVQLEHEWIELEKISPTLPLSFIASEDQLFLEHNGFDLKSIAQAWEEKEQGVRLRGGSTISQQLAKNLFLYPKQSFIRKGLEAYFTVWIELLYSKRRIMELYVNIVELGPGVYGVQAASKKYFKKSPIDLKSYESALIATALPSPKKYKLDRPGPYMIRRAQWVERQMRNLGGNALVAEWY